MDALTAPGGGDLQRFEQLARETARLCEWAERERVRSFQLREESAELQSTAWQVVRETRQILHRR